MKKKNISILTLIALFIGCINAASFEENITNLIEKESNLKVKVVSSKELKGAKDLKLVVLELTDKALQVPAFATNDGNTIIGLSNLFFTANKADENIITTISKDVMAYNDNSQKEVAGKLIEQLKPDEYLTLTSKAKNAKTYFIVADPNCGYCKEELNNINERLKTHNVNIVVVGMLGADSLKKAAYIMNKVNNKSSQKEILNTLYEAFARDFKAPKDIKTDKIEKTTESLFKSGAIQAVPFIYEK